MQTADSTPALQTEVITHSETKWKGHFPEELLRQRKSSSAELLTCKSQVWNVPQWDRWYEARIPWDANEHKWEQYS